MENQFKSSEEKTDHALESLDGIKSVEPPFAFDSNMFARFDAEFSSKAKTPKWFWVAALAILSINVIAAYNYSGTTTVETSTINTNSTTSSETENSNTIGSYYFQGGTDWYHE